MRARRSLALAVAVLALAALFVPGPARAADDCSHVTQDGPCGMDLEAAWQTYTRGDPGVVVAYVEAGINWFDDSVKPLVNRVYVNWHETPVPCDGDQVTVGGTTTTPCSTQFSSLRRDYDLDHNGFVNAADWSNDPRVTDANGTGFLDPEDLIAEFSDGTDRDGNGYADDISGWDFYDDQNDPATYDAAYDHANNQMGRLHHECPGCTILPIKAGAEALDRTDDLAQAWLFAADSGASVITSTTADLGYSRFMRDTVRYLAANGVVAVESSNDFDSTDHQGGMFWPDVLPGNAVVPTSDGSRWTRSDYTSWGSHAMFSVAAHGGTTSEATPTTAGVLGLLLSYGRKAARQGLIDAPLTPQEAVQVLIATSKRVTDPSLPWPGSPGQWNLQYGYGIPDLFDAMTFVKERGVPPVGRITSPEWYTPFDPTRTGKVLVRGVISAPRAQGFHWVLRAGVGPQPHDETWFTIGSGNGTGSYGGQLGTLDLSRIPRSDWGAPFHLSKTKQLHSTEQYTVTLRLKVTDTAGRAGWDRRAINVVHDKNWLPGFPLAIGASGESQPALVDLQGTGELDIVFGDTNGFVHAVDPATGEELPGWPVHTRPVHVLRAHEGVRPGFEPIVADVAVGDLFHSGELDVVATSLTGTVYAFDSHGAPVDGWPKALNTGVQKPPIPRPSLPFTRLPIRGAVAGPTLFDLDGDDTLEVIQGGWDGRVHVWHPGGANAEGWPVKVEMPESYQTPPGLVLVNDQKLDTGPAIGFLQGQQNGPDLVVRPQYTETPGAGLQPGGAGFVFAYDAQGNLLPGWPVRMQGTVEYYGSAQEFITEGSMAPSTADITGTGLGPDLVGVGPVLSPPYLINGAGQIQGTYQGQYAQDQDAPVSFTTSGAFGKLGGAMTFALAETGGLSLAQALLQPESGKAINEYEVAYPATGGAERPGFPTHRQGIDFLGQPLIVDVTGDGETDLIDGGDSNAVMAWDALGNLAPGFPKWTTGWNIFAPAAGDLLSNGKTDLVVAAREGYLFAWRTPGDPSAMEWWRAGHDEWNTGRWGTVTASP